MGKIDGMPLLKKLIDSYGVSGNERDVRNLIKVSIKPYVDEIKIDNMGNFVARKRGNQPVLMLAAHMDEVGLMVKKITKHGKIYCSAIGGIDPLLLVGQRVHLGKFGKHIHGVITTNKSSYDPRSDPRVILDDLYVDTGLDKNQLEKKGIRIGSYVPIEQKTGTLGAKDYIQGKALDDRVGCYILIELAKRLKRNKNEIVFAFTVQEEVGLYGAKTAAWKFSPDWGIAVDVTDADDRTQDPTKFLGRGPCVTIKDVDMIASREVNDQIIKLSKKHKIPIQLEVNEEGTTDAFNIQLSKGGVPSTVIGPCIRNIHTSVGIVHKKDIEDTIRLLELLIKSPPNIKVA